MPPDIVVDAITDYQIVALNRLKVWLYGQRIKARVQRDRAELRQKKEEEEIQKKADQLALFEF